MELTEQYVRVVITSTGGHHFLTQKKFEQLQQASLDDMIMLENGNGFKVSANLEILTVEDYYRRYPEKQSAPVMDHWNTPKDLEDIVDQFAWAATKFKFSDMYQLVTITHRELSKIKTDEGFKDFCQHYRALTPNGALTVGFYTDEKGNKKQAVFAYPFFKTIWEFIKSKRSKQEYAVEMSWEQLASEANGIAALSDKLTTQHPDKWVAALKRSIAKSPNNEYLKSLLRHAETRVKGVTGKKTYNPKYKKYEDAKAAGVI